MSRPGITYLDVSKAAQQITGQGKAPTIELIRASLKTGSNSTIGTHLRAWREQQDPAQQLAIQANLPEELVSLMKGLWDRVIHQASEQIETIKSEAQHETTQLKQNAQHVQQESTRWQQQHHQMKQERDGLTQEKVALEQLMTNSQSERAGLLAKQDGLLQQLQEKQARIDELHRQNQQTQANLEHYREASLEQRQQEQQCSEQQQRELTYELQQLKMDNEVIRQQKMGLQQSHDQLQFAQKNTLAELNKMTLRCETTSLQLTEINHALAQKIESERHWQMQYNNIFSKYDDHSKMTIELQTQHAILSQQMATIKVELNDITEQNKALAHDKWILGQEKAQLFGQLKQWESMTAKT